MGPFPIVKDLDVFKHATAHVFLIPVSVAVYPLSFQGLEEGFSYSIVVTVALAAHTLNHTVLLELFPERLACILNTSV